MKKFIYLKIFHEHIHDVKLGSATYDRAIEYKIIEAHLHREDKVFY